MRSLIVLALCVGGLFAAVQAMEPATFMGVTLDASDFYPVEPEIEGHHHKHHKHHHKRHSWGPPHDPHDKPYWEGRHHAKGEFIHCLKSAVALFNPNDPTTWDNAIAKFVWCIEEHFERCHDAPGLPDDFVTTVPFALFVRGIKALVAGGANGLLHVADILFFYVAGGLQTLPGTGLANPWYVQGGCSAKLVGALIDALAILVNDPSAIGDLAKGLVVFIKKAITDPSGTLGNCAPDVSAVLLALISTSCPASESLYNPLLPLAPPVRCTYTPSLQYENSPGALLGGSVITLLLLSKDPVLTKLGFQLGFTMNRMALAATQTTSFTTCLGFTSIVPPVPSYNGQLSFFLGDQGSTFPPGVGVPYFSGPLPVAGNPQAVREFPLGPDGQRVLCAAIGMMSGPDIPVIGGNPNWQPNLLWQGLADVANAVVFTVTNSALPVGNGNSVTSITCGEAKSLCAFFKAIYSFNPQKPITTAKTVVAVKTTASLAANEIDYKCMTTAAGCSTGLGSQIAALSTINPGWWAFSTSPKLVAGHDLSTVPAWCSC